ncbi:MAG TPA: zinc transporter ZntB [Kofleriaceae bacterium]|nr:zinc transporter ZntB [Kofleriaceae bacterium]
MSGLLHALLLDGAGGAKALDWAGVAAWSPNDGVLWVNLDYTEDDAKQWIEKTIDPLVRDALLDPDPRPRAVARGEDLLLMLRGININAGFSPEDMLSVRAFVEPRRIVTLRHRVSRSLKLLQADLEAGHGAKTAADFTVMLVELIVEHAVTRVDELGDKVAASEDQVLAHPDGGLRAKLADLRRRAIAMRRFLAPQREAMTKLSAINVPWLDPQHRARIGEVADRMTRTVEELDAARDRAAVTQEELSARSAEATNQRLYVLALITAVFLPLGFVCALFSVGIGGVPLKDNDHAFWGLVAAFSVFVAVQLYVFKKRGWL